MIVPTIVHQIWLQGGKLPPPLDGYVDAVRGLCRQGGWIHWLWDTSDLNGLSDESRRMFRFLSAGCSDISQQSNVLRYLILRDQGGLYLDTDVKLHALPGPLEGAWVPIARNMHRAGSFALACPSGDPWIIRLMELCLQAPLHVRHGAGSKLVAVSLGPDVKRWEIGDWKDTGSQPAKYGQHGWMGTQMGHFEMPPVVVC